MNKHVASVYLTVLVVSNYYKLETNLELLCFMFVNWQK